MPEAKYYHARMKLFPILVTMMTAGMVLAETPAPAPQQASQIDLMTMTQDARCKQVVVTCLINGQPIEKSIPVEVTLITAANAG